MRRRRRVPIGTVTLIPYFHADSALLTRHRRTQWPIQRFICCNALATSVTSAGPL